MLIPLIFKNNDTDEIKTKIGKVTPVLARALYAYGLSGKTGILKDYASECSITKPIDYTSSPNYARLTFNKGILSICGGIIFIEQGTEFIVDGVYGIPVGNNVASGSLGIKVDLSKLEGEEVSFFYKTGSLIQNDLQENEIDGVYEFEIYKYSIVNGVLTLTQKNEEEPIFSIDDLLINRGGKVVIKEADKTYKIIYSTDVPKGSPENGTFIIYIGNTLPTTRYDRVLYLIG